MGNDTTPKRILIVDDDLDSSEMLTEALQMLGYDANYVLNGHAALQAVAQQRLDVVVLDVGLPGMDGFQVAQRIRAQPNGRAVRIIVLSGFNRPTAGSELAAAGFDEYLVKPVDIDQLTRAFTRA